jgi:hypothetical protein
MAYGCKNRHKPNEVCSNYQKHKKPQKHKLKKSFKSNFKTRNKTRLCDSKTKTQDVHNKHGNKYLHVNICKHEHEKNLIRSCCKIVSKNDVEQIEGNEGSYSYLYSFGDLAQRSF